MDLYQQERKRWGRPWVPHGLKSHGKALRHTEDWVDIVAAVTLPWETLKKRASAAQDKVRDL